jgi:hypothetical protein
MRRKIKNERFVGDDTRVRIRNTNQFLKKSLELCHNLTSTYVN